jgi:diguanylate cyclase (GGDEF)-like protein
VTERKQLEDKLTYQSTHDVLTGLFNRQYYETEITRLQKSRQYPVSILVMDVNGLKKVNDSMGHDAGDRLLQCAAQALMNAFRPEDLVARIGGDEFAVVLPRTRLDAAQLAATRVKKNITKSNQDCAEHFNISVAIGIASGEPGVNLSDVFKEADQAMYQEKTRLNITR